MDVGGHLELKLVIVSVPKNFCDLLLHVSNSSADLKLVFLLFITSPISYEHVYIEGKLI